MIATHKTKGILDYVHIDIWEPVQTTSLGGSVYFVNFINDYSQKVWVYFVRHKSKTLPSLSYGKLKWKTIQEGRSNASGQTMVHSTQIQDSHNCARSMELRGSSHFKRHYNRMVW